MSAELSQSDELIARYLSGNAGSEDVARLEKLLRDDPDLQDSFLQHARMDVALASAVAATAFEGEVISFPKSRRRKLISIAAAIVLFCGLGAFFLQNRKGVEVEIVSSAGRVADQYTTGKSARIKQFSLEEGELKVRIKESGVVVNLEGPGVAGLSDPMNLILIEGSASIDSGTEGVGFTVQTPEVSIVDTGTRFEVAAEGSTHTDIIVLEGGIEITDLAEARQGQDRLDARLFTGDAVRVDSGGVGRRLRSVEPGHRFLARPDAGWSGIISDVSDSNTSPHYRRFYSIKPKAMQPGVRAYSTLGKPHWQPVDEEAFPSELQNADVVETFFGDRKELNLVLEVDLTIPANLYIFFDARGDVPEWLAADFQKTSHEVLCGPWGDGTSKRIFAEGEEKSDYLTFHVWKRTVNRPGIITLGPTGAAEGVSMYGIAAKKM